MGTLMATPSESAWVFVGEEGCANGTQIWKGTTPARIARLKKNNQKVSAQLVVLGLRNASKLKLLTCPARISNAAANSTRLI